jgi:hypothetical protein
MYVWKRVKCMTMLDQWLFASAVNIDAFSTKDQWGHFNFSSSQIHKFNFVYSRFKQHTKLTNSRFQLYDFTISTLWIHGVNFTNAGVQLNELWFHLAKCPHRSFVIISQLSIISLSPYETWFSNLETKWSLGSISLDKITKNCRLCFIVSVHEG